MPFDKTLLQRLRQAKQIVFFTGAGASTESGVPTFRDRQNSLWGDFDVNVYATEFGYRANSALVWQWYMQRRKQLQNLSPNLCHQVIAAWQRKTHRVTVITQNIDGFHQQAGSQTVIELHGNIALNKCLAHGHAYHEAIANDRQPPRCPQCDSPIRPDVVWFDEELSVDAYALAEEESFHCDIFVCIGSSLEVFPAANLPIYAKQAGVYLLQINLQSTSLDRFANQTIFGKAGEILPQLYQAAFADS